MFIIINMFLSNQSIKKLLKIEKLVVQPEAILKPASIRLHLSDKFTGIGQETKIKQEHLLGPKKFILGSILEKIKLPNDHIGIYSSSATLAKAGITPHMGSILVQPGFEGNLTPEIFNASDKPFLLKSGMRIGQLLIIKLDSLPKN